MTDAIANRTATGHTSTFAPTELTDLEVYCWLKSNLQPPYHIVAEPSPQYFSEWLYCYRIYRADQEIAVLAGDFRVLPAGKLVTQARELLAQIQTEDTPW